MGPSTCQTVAASHLGSEIPSGVRLTPTNSTRSPAPPASAGALGVAPEPLIHLFLPKLVAGELTGWNFSVIGGSGVPVIALGKEFSKTRWGVSGFYLHGVTLLGG